jgi:hypothetical protein
MQKAKRSKHGRREDIFSGFFQFLYGQKINFRISNTRTFAGKKEDFPVPVTIGSSLTDPWFPGVQAFCTGT